MAQNNFFVRAFSDGGDLVFGAKVRSHGDSSIAAAMGWMNGMGFRGEPETDARILGRKTPEIEVKFPYIRLVVILEVDPAFQCPECGHPKDEPRWDCYCDEGCWKFRHEEPEVVIDLDKAQKELEAMFG